MKDDPVAWLEEHIEKGTILFEKARTLDDNFIAKDDWERRAKDWSRELEEGVERISSRDLPHVRTVGKVPLALINILPADHPYSDAAAAGWESTATGEGAPGNNRMSFLGAQIERAREVAAFWRQRPPGVPRARPGPARKVHEAALKTARELMASELSRTAAAEKAVRLHGRGPHSSVERAERAVRDLLKDSTPT